MHKKSGGPHKTLPCGPHMARRLPTSDIQEYEMRTLSKMVTFQKEKNLCISSQN